MSTSLEEKLTRELREIAGDLHVPPMPALPTQRRTAPRWLPALVAAVAVLVLLGAVTLLQARGGGRPEPAPAPPSRTEEPRQPSSPIAKVQPSVPYLLDRHLFYLDQQVAGDYYRVWSGGTTWLAQRTDGSWWYSTDTTPHRIDGVEDAVPVLSPGGTYVAWVQSQEGMVTGFATAPGGEGLGGTPVDLGDPSQGNPVRVRAVTDDGLVVVQGQATAMIWRPLIDNKLADLSTGDYVLGGSTVGLVVNDQVDGTQGSPSLAKVSAEGILRRTDALPTYDDLAVSPDGRHVLWAEPGTMGGEVSSVASLQVAAVGGTALTVTPPQGWSFAVYGWTWEDQTFVAQVVAGGGQQRMARCDPEQARCVFVQTS